ncbi:hypothetical protein [Kitasatospora sp. NPDC057198]|uniref:hypothetical protein n=1 Tax=Kitasatospora sp. NPDC057198 TaxID=3346046 RepID=UPI00362701B8
MSADALGRLTRRTTADGRATGSPDAGTPWSPQSLAALDGRCLLGLDRSGVLNPIPLVPGAVPSSAHHMTLHHNARTLLSADDGITALGASTRYAALGDGKGRVHLWSLRDPGLGARTVEPHRSGVTAVACLDLPDTGTLLLLTGGLDGAVRLWDSGSGELMPGPVERRNAIPTALGAADTEAGPVLAVAWSDRRIHLWHLFSGRVAPLPALHDSSAVALTADGRLLTAGAGGLHALRLDLDGLWADEG